MGVADQILPVEQHGPTHPPTPLCTAIDASLPLTRSLACRRHCLHPIRGQNVVASFRWGLFVDLLDLLEF